ncbi:sugar ABC transporter permease [Paenibacillus sp. LHD-117]|uniref:carbohydrate ABC transporter permease n=1 Tax=Paenibacillus sp. LHD-117 TaxID=3071412 RepID=UPI0027E008D6|nr:sugar ABC transporter permease [Paenibacillus sp. LHD-117]MDQ6421452.1 sugar ABC transporter permease [Paenibacillus sp. LHD-117]
MRNRSWKIKENYMGHFFVFPALIYMLVFIGYPIINNFILSFQDVNVMTLANDSKQFVGLANYMELFKEKDSVLLLSLRNSLIYTVASITFQFVIGFSLALLFVKKFKLAQTLRGLVMISWLIPVTITALLFKFMFSVNGGIINEILLFFHFIDKPIEWLLQPASAMWSLIIANSWIGIPFNMILLTTGLSTIPNDVYESANIDGANRSQKFFHITIPLLKPAIASVLILGFIFTFKVFDLVYVMTQGGPVNATEMLSTFSYKLSFTEFNFSKGAAVANVLFVILFIISLGYLKLIKEEEEVM